MHCAHVASFRLSARFPRRAICFAAAVVAALLCGSWPLQEIAAAAQQKQRRTASAPRVEMNVDVVVYGGTSAGAIAAVQVRRMGHSVVLIEPGKHIGGLTSGGLGATDIGNKAAIGGLSRDFYRRIKQHYDEASAWRWQKQGTYTSRRQRPGDDSMWTFEPHVAEAIYEDLLNEARVNVLLNGRLDRDNGVTLQDGRITSIRLESRQIIYGKMFIDATYEGDLLAAAGVKYHVGREANDVYGETLNGVQVRNAVHHQFVKPVDPYVVPGDPSSGLLPGINPKPLPVDGSGDRKVQAYCFRMCTTDVPENQAEWVRPADYDPVWYELLLRNFEAGDHRVPWHPSLMPNRKTDTNNNFAISTDFIGQNYDYPDAGYEEREAIFQRHLSWQQGLMWTLANHERVPAEVRKHFQTWKPAKDEFTETGHWPHQLYVREARRMIADVVMTQHHCQGREIIDDPVGLAAYTMDSHNIQRYVDAEGHVRNEGDVQVGGFAPYAISWRSIRPKQSECRNLLVPACLSASHIAYGSIRMEPVFMVLGQSAATAACLAIEEQLDTIQALDYAKLRKRLEADGQELEWDGPRPPQPVDISTLKGIVVDDSEAELTGSWGVSSSVRGFVGSSYRHDSQEGKGGKRAVYIPNLPRGGRYDVYFFYTANPNRDAAIPVTVRAPGVHQTVRVNAQKPTEGLSRVKLGTFDLPAEKQTSVTVSTEGTTGYVVIDAVQFVPVED